MQRSFRLHKLLLLLALHLYAGSLLAGDTISESRYQYIKSVHFYYQPGTFLLTNQFLRGKNPNKEPYGFYQSFSAQYGIHTDGNKLWQQLYGYPVWGFGIYNAFFPGDHELGYPFALYMYMNAPFKRWEKWSVNYEVDFGISFNWKSHGFRESGYFYPISSFANVFFDFGINSKFQLSKKLDIFAGLDFIHFSNGSVKVPNLGVNMVATRIGINYIFNDRPEPRVVTPPEYIKKWEWLITFSPSVKQAGYKYINKDNDTIETKSTYGIYTLSTGINRQFSYMIKAGCGIDFSYNGAYGSNMLMPGGSSDKTKASFGEKFLIGIFPSFELVINRLSLIVQPGFYVYRPPAKGNETPVTYQRLGIRYYLYDHIVTGINVRAYNFSKADFIECYLGYSLEWENSSWLSKIFRK